MFTLVAGTGYTGRRVLEQLPVEESVGLSRTRIDTGHAFHQFDFDASALLPFDLAGKYAVLYTCPPDGEDDTRLQHFLALLKPAPARIVYISTTGVYGDRKGAVVTEDADVDPVNSMARARIAAESILTAYAEQSGCELVILRAPGIYGPGRLPVQRISEDGAFLDEEDCTPGNRIHVDDLASCCIAALDDATPPDVYNVGDGDHRSATWFAQEVARQAGLPAPRLISRAEAEEEFSSVRLAFMSSSRIVDTTKLREVIGVTPRYADPAEGIAASLGL